MRICHSTLLLKNKYSKEGMAKLLKMFYLKTTHFLNILLKFLYENINNMKYICKYFYTKLHLIQKQHSKYPIMNGSIRKTKILHVRDPCRQYKTDNRSWLLKQEPIEFNKNNDKKHILKSKYCSVFFGCDWV